MAIERHGRRTPLKPAIREALWAIYGYWRDLMHAHGIVLHEQVRRGAMEYTAHIDPKPYQALVIDEAQDLSPVALRLLLNLVETPEHVYLTADASQSIYRRGFSWKQVHHDLAFTGRTILLKQNFRNTAQILAACASILAGSQAGEEESIQQLPSTHQGDPPLIRLVSSDTRAAEAIRDFFLEAARYYRLPTHSGAVFCTSNREGRELAERLGKLGMPAVFQSGRELDITVPMVKVLTLHSARGWNFPSWQLLVWTKDACRASMPACQLKRRRCRKTSSAVSSSSDAHAPCGRCWSADRARRRRRSWRRCNRQCGGGRKIKKTGLTTFLFSRAHLLYD